MIHQTVHCVGKRVHVEVATIPVEHNPGHATRYDCVTISGQGCRVTFFLDLSQVARLAAALESYLAERVEGS